MNEYIQVFRQDATGEDKVVAYRQTGCPNYEHVAYVSRLGGMADVG